MLPWRPVMAVPDLFKVRVDPQVPPSCDTGFILDRLFGFRSRHVQFGFVTCSDGFRGLHSEPCHFGF